MQGACVQSLVMIGTKQVIKQLIPWGNLSRKNMEDLFKLMITQRKQVHLTTKPSNPAWQQSHATEARMCPKTVKKKMAARGPHPAQRAQRLSAPRDMHTHMSNMWTELDREGTRKKSLPNLEEEQVIEARPLCKKHTGPLPPPRPRFEFRTAADHVLGVALPRLHTRKPHERLV